MEVADGHLQYVRLQLHRYLKVMADMVDARAYLDLLQIQLQTSSAQSKNALGIVEGMIIQMQQLHLIYVFILDLLKWQ
jgi:hypothetical protein